MSRLLRILRCIMGPGRWDAEALAQEFECSTRTVHRYLQTLTMAGIPFYFDQEQRAYRVQTGFRFADLEAANGAELACDDPKDLLPAAKRLLEDGERFIESLRQFCMRLEEKKRPDPS